MKTLVALRAPLSVNFELTKVCNHGCSFCSSGSATGAHQHPSRATVLRVIDALAAAEVFEIRWFGGEFLTFPGWEDIVAYAAERGFFMGFVSNGSLVRARTVDILARNGMTGGAMSLHGPPDVHDAVVRCPGAFLRTIEGIRRCAERGIAVSVLFTPTRANVARLADLARWLADQHVPVNGIHVGRLCPCGEANDAWERDRLTLNDYRELFTTMRSIRAATGIDVRMGDAFPLCRLPLRDWELIDGCWQGTGFGQINADGSLKSCSLLGGSYGNVLETPLTEIWTERLAALRRLDHLPLRCKICPFFCGGGCSASRPGATHFAADEFIPGPGEESVLTAAEWLGRAVWYYAAAFSSQFRHRADSLTSTAPLPSSARPRVACRYRIREDLSGYLGYFKDYGMLTLNRAGARALELLDGTSTVAELSGRVARECDCAPEDVVHFIRQFDRKGFLTYQNDP